MREILFRGKRTDNGEWIYGNLLSTDDDGICIIQNHVPHHLLKNYEVDPETVCQYTGLTDENGMKIFEGDIVKYESYDGNHYTALIQWHEDFAGFAFHVEVISYFCPQRNEQMRKGRGIEVIRNIFDDHDLLE